LEIINIKWLNFIKDVVEINRQQQDPKCCPFDVLENFKLLKKRQQIDFDRHLPEGCLWKWPRFEKGM